MNMICEHGYDLQMLICLRCKANEREAAEQEEVGEKLLENQAARSMASGERVYMVARAIRMLDKATIYISRTSAPWTTNFEDAYQFGTIEEMAKAVKMFDNWEWVAVRVTVSLEAIRAVDGHSTTENWT